MVGVLDLSSVEDRVASLLLEMTIEEKIGQLQQVAASAEHVPEDLKQAIRDGRIGSVINLVDAQTANDLQWLASTQSRHGIPLLVGRDVVHGFKTVFPIPLGQAATWNPSLVTKAARVAALEAAATGVNWTFAPMIDIGRDPRWGRVAEGFGEDPYLTGVLGAAMVRGFQGDDLAAEGHIAACAKHFAGYGASESGRDYNTTNIPENELRNVHLVPFKAAVDAGVATIMTSFSEIDGVPASASEFLLKRVLREEWQFDGMVVSDWDSIRQLAVHGFTANDRDSAYEAASAGVDMEMSSTTYAEHLAHLVHDGVIAIERIDTLVANVLRLKLRLGLFESPYTDSSRFPAPLNAEHLQLARDVAVESVVLLKNDNRTLPLSREAVRAIAVVGPLADDKHDQLGTWIFDGDHGPSVTVLHAITDLVGEHVEITYARGVPTTRSRDESLIAEAVEAAQRSDVVVLVAGEESILSGEAHCRSDIGLPGAQPALLAALAKTGKPVIMVIMAGRALALQSVLHDATAVLYAWHPGVMGGAAIADLLFGVGSPSGKLPTSLPRTVGQIPIYYGHKHTGKPATDETVIHMDDIEARAPQLSIGNTSFHLDVHPTPLFPFGFGLSYSSMEYANISVNHHELARDGVIELSADITNTGTRPATEVAQLYIRDVVANVTRPVRELKAFEKLTVAPGERRTVRFTVTANDLAFYGRDMRRRVESGWFHAWIGGDSTTQLRTEFLLV